MNVQKFQQLAAIASRDVDELEKSIMLVQCFTGMTEEQIEALPRYKFDAMLRSIRRKMTITGYKLDYTKPQQIIRVNGRWYRLEYDVKTAGQYVEGTNFAGDIVGNLHLILASIATPLRLTIRGWKEYDLPHEVKADDMLLCDFRHVYHAAVFFYAVYTTSLQSIRPYLMETMTPEKVNEVMQGLTGFLDGSTMPNWFRNLKESQFRRYGNYQPSIS